MSRPGAGWRDLRAKLGQFLTAVNRRISRARGMLAASSPTTVTARPAMLTTSPDGYALIQAHEGRRLAAYRDPVGVWTIGYGHAGDVQAGDVITPHQAEVLLAADVAVAEAAVRRLVRVPLTQGQFDALVSFVFNLGAGRLSGSTLLAKLNARDYAGAAREFGRWVKGTVDGRKVNLPGLVKRRAAERALFEREAQS